MAGVNAFAPGEATRTLQRWEKQAKEAARDLLSGARKLSTANAVYAQARSLLDPESQAATALGVAPVIASVQADVQAAVVQTVASGLPGIVDVTDAEATEAALDGLLAAIKTATLAALYPEPPAE